MATINATGHASSTAPNRSWQTARFSLVQPAKVDFGDNATGGVFATKADNSDVVQVLQVKSGWAIMNVIVQVVTACTGAGTITANVGDGGDADGWNSAVDLTSTGYSKGEVGTDAYATGHPRIYTSTDTIDLTLTVSGGDGGPIDSGVVYLWAVGWDLSENEALPAAAV